MKGLTKKDAEKYLQFGTLTQPFLANDYVLERVLHDYNHKISLGEKTTKIERLMGWIAHNVKYSNDEKFNAEHKFNRTAQEIWESKIVTGCTDKALLFCTFARQIGIPTAFLHTAEFGWLAELKNNSNPQAHKGHTFCECFYDGAWLLVDSTCKKIVKNYNVSKIVLPYNNLGSTVFVPYFRGLDFGQKMTLKQHNQQEELLCKNL